MSEPTTVTVRELAGVLKGWLVETLHQELDSRRSSGGAQEPLGELLRRDEADAARRVRTQRFREALAGLETLLVGESELDYRPVLDHVLHNVGAGLLALGLLEPQGGLVDAPEFDFRAHRHHPVMVLPRRYVPLPTVTRVLRGLGVGRGWVPGTTVHLVEHREWQPRFLRRPAYDDERYSLFAWQNLYSRDISFLPMGYAPRSEMTGPTELLMLGQRASLLGRLLDSSPRSEAQVIRLGPRDFTQLLRALLLDYEQLHSLRKREVAEQDQLGTMLWDFLTRDG